MTRTLFGVALATTLALVGQAHAVTITMSCGSVAQDQAFCRSAAAAWSAQSGHEVEIITMPSSATEHLALIQQMVSSQSSDIDIFTLDIIWPGIVAAHMYDLTPLFSEDYLAQYFAPILEANRIDGKLVAIPWFTDAGLLYYRRDLLEKYGKSVPTTWQELTETAKEVMEGERAAGNAGMWGLVFQGRAYEGLTCDALEWIDSFRGGTIVNAESGEVTVNNPNAVAAIDLAATWIGDIAPPGVLNYQEEEARGVWQSGNAVFMRNWPYAYSAGQSDDSPIKDKFGVTALPKGGADGKHTGTLGGWNLGVSAYSENPEVAADFVRYLTSAEEQKRRAIEGSYLATIASLYSDPDVLAANVFMGELVDTFANAVARPSQKTGARYNQVSNEFWNAVHATLSGNGSAEQNLAALEDALNRLSRGGRW